MEQNASDKATVKHENYGSLKVVVPLTSDEKMMHAMKLRNLKNAAAAVQKIGGTMEAVVVLYGRGVSLLKSPPQEIATQIDDLKQKGVRFAVCENSLLEQNIDYHALYEVEQGDIVPSGFAEVAYLQAEKSYVVDPAN